jgi:hypothetical protein
MKKLILGTVAAAAVLGSVSVASAQMRDRTWFDLNAFSAQGTMTQDANKNFAPDSIKYRERFDLTKPGPAKCRPLLLCLTSERSAEAVPAATCAFVHA